MTPAQVVLGFRPHTYWTAVVAVAGETDEPQVVRRARIDFAEGETRLVYHRAAEMGPDEGARWAETVRSRTRATAGEAIARLLKDLAGEGRVATRAVVPRGGGHVPERLADIVRSHSAQHAAEGEFYRDVVADACRDAGLEVSRIIERELHALTADLLGGVQAPWTSGCATWVAPLGHRGARTRGWPCSPPGSASPERRTTPPRRAQGVADCFRGAGLVTVCFPWR